MKRTSRRGETGVTVLQLVVWFSVVAVFVAVVAVALYQTANRPTPIPTDPNGKASFDTQTIPQLHVSSTCDRSGGAPKLSSAPQSNTRNVQYTEVSSTEESCT